MQDLLLEPIFSLVPITGSVISFVLFLLMIQSLKKTAKIQYSFWAASFLFFSLATFLEGISPIYRWTELNYRVYYISALLLVYFLGAGQLFLMLDRGTIRSRIYGRIYAAYGVLFGGTAIILVFLEPVDVSLLVGVIPGGTGWVGSAVILDRPIMRILSPLLTVPGSLIVIFGSVLSYFRTGLKFNVVICVGALLLAAAGVFASLFRITVILFLGEAVGILLLFTGFMISKKSVRRSARQPSDMKSSA